MAEPLAILDALSYRYPGREQPSLRSVDLEIEVGEFVVLAGRSASGKSTLLRALCGLVPHYHGGEAWGDARIGGLDASAHGPAALGGLVGLVAQDPETQVVCSTVRGELELPLEMRGEPEAARARAVEEAALALGIAPLLGRAVDTLSGGELQRVALAAALVGRPRLVLLDEPTSQLDPVAGDELVGLLRRLNEQWGTAVVLAEHRLERCLDAADRVLAMERGAIAFDGEPTAFLEWALAHDRALATPAARLFDLAGLRPLPVGVKEARTALADVIAPEQAVSTTFDGAASAQAGRPARRFPEVALRVRGLHVELDDGAASIEVLRDFSLELGAGERVALMGRNGAGKSTLLRTVAGQVRPAAGSLDAPRGCALLPQSPGDLLVRERVDEELPGEAGAAALAGAGLGHAADADPRDLSGGERQRLALAIVMAGREGAGQGPGLIALDEPTRGMDRARKEALAGWLETLAAGGAAVVVATHDVEFAAGFAERVVLIGEGEVIADGAATEVLAGGWYFSTEVARVLGDRGAISPERGAELIRAHVLEARR